MEIIEVKHRHNLYELFPKNGIGAELGVCKGLNAAHLWNKTLPKELFLVDIWLRDELTYLYHPPELFYDDWEILVRERLPYEEIKLVKQDSIMWLDSIPDNYLDWIYIDSIHTYDHVKVEYEKAILKVKPGGIISGHDFYCHPQAWKTGVIRAVLNQVQNNNLKITHISCEKETASIMAINTK